VFTFLAKAAYYLKRTASFYIICCSERLSHDKTSLYKTFTFIHLYFTDIIRSPNRTRDSGDRARGNKASSIFVFTPDAPK
jgi:hypothetical protein